MRILVLIIGIIIIGLIVWWFFGKHEAESAAATMTGATQTVDVTVKGGYSPEVVELKQGVPATLNFTRTDPSTCLDHVVFPDFGINRELPKGETESITIDTSKPGEYGWACGMDMFHGKLIIK
ncbi:cupredoxin domain-containing protein [Lacticaseibacillus sharpeae]|uniref:Cupredoxin family domain protein n=1 Tax=Lacticaseibacillus sharpeae JCM 1186 = DSM 20505 TaxID=1291052 RepID=A0A0R1ZT19_9LACO|nr:cupredoxin domain-containing protein [Lacticaseibacillus sharpeae]KRM55179.1 cupredoxin family domain protein [Lacticaseibacillus sharpeae JCM 1186 = DSM 20505]